MRGGIFSDERISRRIEELTSSIIAKESVVIHRLAKDEAEQRSFYRLLHNPRLETGQVVEFLRRDCLGQVEAGAHYLVIQDTTQPNFERNRKNISDQRQLGVIGDRASLGFSLHPSLVVCAGTGRCLGFSQVMCWSREAAAPDKVQRAYKSRPIEEKESLRWVASAQSSNQLLERGHALGRAGGRPGSRSVHPPPQRGRAYRTAAAPGPSAGAGGRRARGPAAGALAPVDHPPGRAPGRGAGGGRLV